MGEKQDEYEQIDAVYQEELKQLRELEKRFSVLEVKNKPTFISPSPITNLLENRYSTRLELAWV